jgi:IstB-like ATP binding protein
LEDWTKLFRDVVAVTPLLDRLTHHGHLLEFEGKSWRLKEAVARVAKRASTAYNRPRPAAGLGAFDLATGGAN